MVHLDDGQEGKWCENAVCQILQSCGFDVIPSSPSDDHIRKIDFWVRAVESRDFFPIQFSIDRRAIVGEKGLQALRLGVIPVWIDSGSIGRAIEVGDGQVVADQFWGCVKAVVAAFHPRVIQPSFPR